jgi:REP element-mobilizing transposase RayT
MASTHGRRQLRWGRWDYWKPGSYFITISTINSADLLGQVVGARMRLNAVGQIVADTWQWLGSHYPGVTLDEWMVMPTHLHEILVLTTAAARPKTVGDTNSATRRKPVGELIGAFETRSTKPVNRLRETPGAALWQRNFWERVIRDEYELSKIREYIRRNPETYGPRTYPV